jgi:hypothetical protein
MNPDTTIQDIDRQIFSVLGVPETYFKATGTTDRMISEQDKGFITMMTSVQEEVSRTIMEEVIIPELQLTFGAGSDIEVKWEWNAITDERQSQLRQDAINLYQAGLIMLNEARKLVGMQALDEEEVGELKDEHQSVGTPETVDEIISSIPEDEVPELPEDMQPSEETVDSREEKLKLKEELKQIKPETNPVAPETKPTTKPFMSYDKSKLANLPEAIRGKKVKLLKDEHGNEYAVDLGE